MSSVRRFNSFEEFYPFYLEQHRHPVCRALHLAGVISAICLALVAAMRQEWIWLLLMPLVGYSFSWIGHFIFEKNRPATFGHPFYSLLGDFRMAGDMLRRSIPLR